MKKLIRLVAGVMILLSVASITLFVYWLGPLSKKAVETWAPKVLGVDVKLHDVSIRPFSGTIRLEGLVIGNPTGYSSPSLMELGELQANLQLGSLWSDTLVIESLLIDEPKITYEKRGSTDNFKSLLANVDAFSKRVSHPDKQTNPSDAPSKKIIIEHLLITNGQLSAKLGMMPTATFTLPEIERHNLGGGSQGMDYGQAAEEIINTLHSGALNTLKDGGKATDAILDKAGKIGDAVKGVGDLFKK